MRKLRLDVDRLGVESFETAREPRAAAGTVRGNALGFSQPSIDVECQWTTNPRLDCWAPTYWPGC